MDGEIVQQRSSYRQGLVLGLTMAEIMLLLVFCLLIAMASFLQSKQKKLADTEQQLQVLQAESERDHETLAALAQNSETTEKLKSLFGLTDRNDIDQYWRELVESRTALAELKKSGVSVKELRDRIADLEKLRANGIDADKAVRDADVVSAINRQMTKPGEAPASTLAILDAIDRGRSGPGPAGHQWPPIITLSDAAGYSFNSGSAELSEKLRDELVNKIPGVILENIKKYDVDVIEVVGHTDEQPISILRQSNLDRDLLSVLNNTTGVASLMPADNAGLGLARAVSVVSLLRQNAALANFKLIPLSGAQLINPDETLAILGTTGEDPQRRRIEIRLRKSNPHDVSATITAPPTVLRPKPRPAQRQPPLFLAPTPKPGTVAMPQY
jgi:flagellar motor protein MotB